MAFEILRRLLVFLAFCLAQVLVLNHVQLFHCATPLLYVYFAIIFPRNYPRWASLLWSFALGLCIDMFANMPGVAAGSMTLVAFLQPICWSSSCPAMPKRTSSARRQHWGSATSPR